MAMHDVSFEKMIVYSPEQKLFLGDIDEKTTTAATVLHRSGFYGIFLS